MFDKFSHFFRVTWKEKSVNTRYKSTFTNKYDTCHRKSNQENGVWTLLLISCVIICVYYNEFILEMQNFHELFLRVHSRFNTNIVTCCRNCCFLQASLLENLHKGYLVTDTSLNGKWLQFLFEPGLGCSAEVNSHWSNSPAETEMK